MHQSASKKDFSKENMAYKLSSTVIKSNLIQTGLLLLCFETLKSLIVDQLGCLYCQTLNFRDFQKSEKNSDLYTSYRDEVLMLDKKDCYKASCLWFQSKEVLSKADVDELLAIRLYRNEVAHEPFQRIFFKLDDIDLSGDRAIIQKIRKYSKIISKFYFEFDASIELDKGMLDNIGDYESASEQLIDYALSIIAPL